MTPTNPTPEPWSDVSPLEKRVAALEEALRDWIAAEDAFTACNGGPNCAAASKKIQAAYDAARRALTPEGK